MAGPTIQDILTSMKAVTQGWPLPTVTFSFPTAASTWTAPSGTWNAYGADSEPFRAEYRPFTAAEADIFRAAIAAYDPYIALNFKEVQEPNAIGDIRAAVSSDAGRGASGWAFYPGAYAAAGDVWVNAKNGANFYLLLHELGHALGLAHPYDSGSLIPAEYRTVQYSILAPYSPKYTINVAKTASGIQTFFEATEVGPALYDVFVLQNLYGSDPETGKGDTVYRFNAPKTLNRVLYDASGSDTLDTSENTRASIIDLEPGSFSSIGLFSREEQISYYTKIYPEVDWLRTLSIENNPYLFTWSNNLAIAFGTTIEKAIGGAGNDSIFGNTADNELTGSSGDDSLNGRSGTDTAVFSGASGEYVWMRGTDGRYTVRDTRTGRDGTDTLESIEILRFSDKSVSLGFAFSPNVETAFTSILRAPPDSNAYTAFTSSLQQKITTGLSEAAAIATIVAAAAATTSVASLAYQFFTGKIPSLAGVDYLVSPTGANPNNLNSAYYQSFNLENRYINFAVNLGKIGEGNARFTAEYGSLSLFEATRKAYGTIFGGTPNDTKVTALLSGGRDVYFESYGKDGLAGIGTKAAMVGWLLAEAAKADVGVYAKSNDAWLLDLADGSAPFGVDLLSVVNGYYKTDYIFGGP